MSKSKLDLKDRKILFELDKNSRQSNTKIAKTVGLSKDVVNYRIKKLEKIGIIEKYYAVIDTSKLGYISFRVYLKLIDATPKDEEDMFKYLKECKEVGYAAKIDGNYDINFWVIVKRVYDFEEFYLEFKKHFRQYIGEEKISIFTRIHRLSRAYILNKETREEEAIIFSGEEVGEIDKTDVEILKILSENARIPTVDIAKILKLSDRAVVFRIKQLEKKGIIQGYTTLFNLELLGFETYKVDIFLRDMTALSKLKNFAQMHPNIIYIDQTIGGSDFEIDIEIDRQQSFEKLMDEIRTKFPEIRNWFYFTIRKYHKMSYFPEV